MSRALPLLSSLTELRQNPFGRFSLFDLCGGIWRKYILYFLTLWACGVGGYRPGVLANTSLPLESTSMKESVNNNHGGNAWRHQEHLYKASWVRLLTKEVFGEAHSWPGGPSGFI